MKNFKQPSSCQRWARSCRNWASCQGPRSCRCGRGATCGWRCLGESSASALPTQSANIFGKLKNFQLRYEREVTDLHSSFHRPKFSERHLPSCQFPEQHCIAPHIRCFDVYVFAFLLQCCIQMFTHLAELLWIRFKENCCS